MWRGPAWVPPAAPRIETDDRLTRLEGRVGDLERKLDSIRQLLAPDAAAPGASPAACPLTEEGRAAVLDLIRQNRKIEAIKAYREKTGSGLKEAKDAVEAMERGGRA
ncbi:MAG: ribosomal protein L7/L12 [Planctomycetes bacterium]|nr:ribosomal protein L7/L12 [Planctomycetota bacterium]